jgi:hypothetical protein
MYTDSEPEDDIETDEPLHVVLSQYDRARELASVSSGWIRGERIA